MLLYFFSMAGHIWWVVLTVTWYLAAKCHWAHEAIFRNAQYLHFAAWAIPAAMTIGILAMGKVDGDPLSGVCFTGLTDPTIVRAFLIAPLCICLFVGTCFLIAGFVSLFKIRTIIKTGGSKTDDLEKLIVRIGVFSLLYLLPAAVVIGCYIYESRMMDTWMLNWYANEVCRNFDPRKLSESVCITQLHKLIDTGALPHDSRLLATSSGKQLLTQLEKPAFELFMIKYLMNLIVGITSGIWIWSGKTVVSWHTFFARLLRCPLPAASRGRGNGGANTNVGGVGLTLTQKQLQTGSRLMLAPNHQPPPAPQQQGWPRGAPTGATDNKVALSNPQSNAVNFNWSNNTGTGVTGWQPGQPQTNYFDTKLQ